MGDGEGGHYGNQRAKPPERDHQTKQKQQMVRSIQDMKEAQLHKLGGGLEPARIQANEARITEKFKRTNRSARRQETQPDHHARGEPVEPRMNRKARRVGL